jgi:hypothetical protein
MLNLLLAADFLKPEVVIFTAASNNHRDLSGLGFAVGAAGLSCA